MIHRVSGHVLYELAVDLEVIDRQTAQIAEGGHAAAKVIERNGAADFLKAIHQLSGACQVRDCRCFSHFEADAEPRQPESRELGGDKIHYLRIAHRSTG